MLNRINNLLKKLLLLIIKMYKKVISPYLGNRCRFYPCCSDYSIQAISKYGIVKGLYMSIKRIISCNPFNPGGIEEI